MKTFTNAIVLLSISAANAFGDNLESQEFIGRYHDLVPEAYTACEDKNARDAAQFINHCGETVTGTCEQGGDRLVLRPDRLPRENADGGAND